MKNDSYSWLELQQYVEEYVKHHTRLLTDDTEFMKEMNWTELDARDNTIKNLEQSMQLLIPNMLNQVIK